jgi:hypothetical protein
VGPQGPQGETGPQGPAGPQYVINAVVDSDGTFIVNDRSAGVTLTVNRTGPGDYLVTIGGMGTGCPVPIANPFAPTFMYLNGGGCGGGTLTTTVQTGDGLDHPFAFSAVGWAPTAEASVASRTSSEVEGTVSLPASAG